VVRRVLGLSIYIMKNKKEGERINMSDLRFQMKICKFKAQLFFLKARQIGHWLRNKEGLARALLNGVFLIERIGELDGGTDVDDVEYLANFSKKLSVMRGRSALMEEYYKHMTKTCLVPEYAVSALASDKTPVGKQIYYTLIREGFIRMMLADYSEAHKMETPEGTAELGERRKELCKKHQISNEHLDSWKEYFRGGHCPLCEIDTLPTEKSRELHFRYYHDMGLRDQELSKAIREGHGEQNWEKKLRQASERKKENDAEREKRIAEDNLDRMRIVTKLRAKDLGTYNCYTCRANITTGLSGLERHLDGHELNYVTKLYWHEQKKRWHPQEQHWSNGLLVPQPGALLKAFAVKGVKYLRGSKWKCEKCNWSIEWKKGSTGQMGARVVEKIEEHIKEREAMNGCKTEEQKRKEKERKEKRGKGGKGKRGKGKFGNPLRVNRFNQAK
jgi:hypothetical protein